MPLIERISQMQKQGLTNEEIIKRLQEEGASPKDINEAIDQSQVKSAVSEQPPQSAGMQPSVMTAPIEAAPAAPNAPPPAPEQPMTMPAPQPMQPATQPIEPRQPIEPQMPAEQMMMPAPGQMPPSEQQPMFQEQEAAYGYPAQEYPAYETASDTEMITEIAEQIVNEKSQKTEKQILEMIRFKTETQGKINNIDDRLKRIEMLIDRLQTSILGKIGEYGRNISDLKSEMETTQESFSKILNPLTENIEELRKITRTKTPGSKTPATKVRKGRGKKDSFENYLRK